MGPLSTETAPRPASERLLDGLYCGVIAGLAASLTVLLLRDGRRRVHLRRAREVLSDRVSATVPFHSPPWP
ncbi:hypothetical protein [Kitasatospora kazusensis]|uniref:hypothetical protein n=1 Tax=Kitasatospora kazusensis TaxID=407974 RepID=UPI0031E48706